MKRYITINIKINWHKHHKSYIQSRLSETEGQTNCYIEHSIMIEAVLHELLRLHCIYYNHIYSWLSIETSGVLLKWQLYTRSSMILLSLDINALKKLSNLFRRLTRMCGDPTTKGNKYLLVWYGKLNMHLLLSVRQHKYPRCSYWKDPTVDIHKKNSSKNKTLYLQH